jgi:hypothetical protein
VVVANLVADPVVNQAVHKSYSAGLKPYSLPILVVESCEVIAVASIDVHVQLKLQLVKDPQVALPNAEDYSDSDLLDD